MRLFFILVALRGLCQGIFETEAHKEVILKFMHEKIQEEMNDASNSRFYKSDEATQPQLATFFVWHPHPRSTEGMPSYLTPLLWSLVVGRCFTYGGTGREPRPKNIKDI
jgi:hypothetical protein